MTKRDRSKAAEPAETEPTEVIFVERQFPVVLRWPLIWGLIIILVGLIPWSISTANVYSWQPIAVNWMLISGVFLLLYWGYHFIGWYFTVLILTDKDITYIKQIGPFKRDVQSLTLNNIQTVNYSIPGLQASIFHFGNLNIETLSGSGHFKIKTMFHPADLQAEILDAMQALPSTDTSKIVYDSEDNTEAE